MSCHNIKKDVGERAFGKWFRIVVDISVIGVQLGVCTVFLSNIGENVSSVFREVLHIEDIHNNSTNSTIYDGSHEADSTVSTLPFLALLGNARTWMTLVLLPVLALSFLPNLKVLAPSIALATVLMFLSFGLIGITIGENWSSGLAEWREKREEGAATFGFFGDVDWKQVPLATCAIMYSLEGDQLILPIESAMAHPEKFGKVFVISFGLIGLLFCVFSSVCVVAFGDVNDGSITAFLLDHRADLAESSSGLSTVQLVLMTNVIVSLSILFTYPLQLFPAVGLMGQIVSLRTEKNKNNGSDESVTDESDEKEKGDAMKLKGDSTLLRFCLVIFTYIVAMVVPHLQILISLVGAITGSATSLLIPPILALRFVLADFSIAFRENYETKKYLNAYYFGLISFFVGLIIIGVIYAILGTTSSIKDLIDMYNGNDLP